MYVPLYCVIAPKFSVLFLDEYASLDEIQELPSTSRPTFPVTPPPRNVPNQYKIYSFDNPSAECMQPLLASDSDTEYHELRQPAVENLSSAAYSTLNHGGDGHRISNTQTSEAPS